MKKIKTEAGYLLKNEKGYVDVSYNYNFGKKEIIVGLYNKIEDTYESFSTIQEARQALIEIEVPAKN